MRGFKLQAEDITEFNYLGKQKKITINEIINNLTDPSVQHLIDNRSAIILISFNLLIKTIQLIDFAITFPTHKIYHHQL